MALYEWVVHVLERVSVLDVVRHMSTRSLEFRSRDKALDVLLLWWTWNERIT